MDDDKAAFYPVDRFPLLKELQENYQTIVEELKSSPIWIEWGSDYRDEGSHCLFLNGMWKVCPVYFGNYDPVWMNVPGITNEMKKELIGRLPDLFPKTTAMLKKNERINYAAFSRLYPKSRLAPHAHRNPHNRIMHLGLIIPPGNTCGLKVGDDTHIWNKAGDAVVFNDNLQHSAWNDSDIDRIVFYLDFQYTTLAERVYGRTGL